MAEIKPPQQFQELPLAIVKNVIVLATSGFGVVVALAWNEFIKKFIEDYVDPFLGKGGGLASLFVYAFGVTLLAVLVTMQLSSLQRKLELLGERFGKRRKTEKEKSV